MHLPRTVLNAIKVVHPRFGLRDSDVLLASYPKSGNTWMRFIWANMVSLMELGGREIDFEYLNTRLVAEYDSHSYGDVEFDCLPRAVKTHRPYDVRAFGKNRSVYVMRHPGDVAVSYFEYRGAQGEHDTKKSTLKAFVRDPEYGVPAWCEHVRSWRSQAGVVIQYEELKTDAVAAVQRALDRLGISHIRGDVVERAVERSSFDELRSIEEEKGHPLPGFDSDYRFMRRGATGEWKERFDREDVRYLRSQLRQHGLDTSYSIDLTEGQG